MSLSLSEVAKIAKLARLGMSPSEMEAIRHELNAILGMIAEMQAVDTEMVEPMSHSQALSQRLREDIVTETSQREAFQAIAPQVEQGLYLVPKVIE